MNKKTVKIGDGKTIHFTIPVDFQVELIHVYNKDYNMVMSGLEFHKDKVVVTPLAKDFMPPEVPIGEDEMTVVVIGQ